MQDFDIQCSAEAVGVIIIFSEFKYCRYHFLCWTFLHSAILCADLVPLNPPAVQGIVAPAILSLAPGLVLDLVKGFTLSEIRETRKEILPAHLKTVFVKKISGLE